MTGDVDIRDPTGDPEMVALVHRYLMPGQRYLELVGGNFLRLPNPEHAEFIESLRHDAEAITDHDLGILLTCVASPKPASSGTRDNNIAV